MAKRTKMPTDLNQRAKAIVDLASGERAAAADAAFVGQVSAVKGGKARAERLTSEQRSAIARKAAQARWKAKNSD